MSLTLLLCSAALAAPTVVLEGVEAGVVMIAPGQEAADDGAHAWLFPGEDGDSVVALVEGATLVRARQRAWRGPVVSDGGGGTHALGAPRPGAWLRLDVVGEHAVLREAGTGQLQAIELELVIRERGGAERAVDLRLGVPTGC